MPKIIKILSTVSLLILFCLPHPFVYAQNKIIAIVNDDVITEKDYLEFINFTRIELAQRMPEAEVEKRISAMQKDLLERLIEDRLIIQQAKKVNISVDKLRVKSRIDEIKKQYGSEAAFQEALKRQGLVQADLEQKIREQFMMFQVVEAKVRAKIIVNPAEVTRYYEENHGTMTVPQRRKVLVLISDSQESLTKAREDIVSGSPEEEVVKKYVLSKSELNAAKEELRNEISAIVFSLNSGEISAVSPIDGKFYLFKITEITPLHQLSLEEAKETIHGLLFNQKMQAAMVTWLDELKKKSYLKIF